jgi:hypothetical protein
MDIEGTTCNLVLLPENHFLYCLDQIWVHSLLVSQIPTGGSKEVGREYTNVMIHLHPMFYRDVLWTRGTTYIWYYLKITLPSII